MKRSRFIAAALAAVTAAAGISLLSGAAADAQWHSGMPDYRLALTALPDGDAGVTVSQGLAGYAVVTDSKGLDAALFDGCTVYEETDASEWVSHLPDAFRLDDNRYYVVDTNPSITRVDGTFQVPYTVAAMRRIRSENAGIRRILSVSRETDGTAEWGGGFVGILPTGDPVRTEVDMAAASGYAEALEALHSGSYNGAYALLTAAREQAQRLAAENPELCDLAFPTVTVSYDPGTWVYSYAEVGAVLTGDVNGDGIVNAEDASRILVRVSELGLGGEATAEELLCMDYNADGQITAEDASAVLIYAANAGLHTDG